MRIERERNAGRRKEVGTRSEPRPPRVARTIESGRSPDSRAGTHDDVPSNDAFPCLRRSGVEPFENSLTVAGAVPALLCKQRTGFPFHPVGNCLWDTRNQRILAGVWPGGQIRGQPLRFPKPCLMVSTEPEDRPSWPKLSGNSCYPSFRWDDEQKMRERRRDQSVCNSATKS
jgi:hypothetical protein